MSVLVAFMDAMIMQLATTLKGVTPAFVTVDTQAMGFPAHQYIFSYHPTSHDKKTKCVTYKMVGTSS